MKIGIGNDHVAVEMKNEIKAYIEEKGHEVVDFGTKSYERCNYPVYGEEVDISLSANKVNGIRACVCSEPYSARLSKQHNNTNIIAFGARVIGIELAKMIVDEWLNAEYEGGRHQVRIDMIKDIEEKQKQK